jgi:acyl-CoA thioester hydrolase
MDRYAVPIQIRWADIDQNRHLRHSAYYDFGATVRMAFLSEHGLTTEKMEELKIGPMLFREEAIFKREIRLEDRISVDVEILQSKADYSRWSLRHQFIKEDGTVAAIVQIDGAWIDLVRRKITAPGDFIVSVFKAFPLSPGFQWIPDRKPAQP